MYTPYYIAKRYLFSRNKSNVINIITLLATLLVVVVTAVFFILLSGFSGLKEFSLRFYNASDPDILIKPNQGKTFIFTDSLRNILSDKDIRAFTKVLDQRAFFHYRDKEHIAYLRGVDSNYTHVVKMDTTVFAGKWLSNDMPYGIVVGNGIAAKLSLGIDYIDPVTIYVPKPGLQYTPDVKSMVNSLKTQTIGLFSLIEETDGAYVYAPLPAVQELLNYPDNRISSIQLALNKGVNAAKFARDLQNKTGPKLTVLTRHEINAVFYRMLNSENLLLYFISTLLLIMALFNIIGTLIMMIIDKRENLKTLLAMGLEIQQLKQIFIIQGFLLTLAGMIIGLVIGAAAILLQLKYHFVRINPVMPYPVAFRWNNLLWVILTIVILGYIAARIASSRINDRLMMNR